MEAVITGLTSGLQTMGTDVMGAIGTVVPYALPVMGAMLVIGIGIKVFKKVTGK